jgi:hypothetical protein
LLKVGKPDGIFPVYRSVAHSAEFAIGKGEAVEGSARHVLRLTEKQIDELLKNGDFVEVRYEQEISK